MGKLTKQKLLDSDDKRETSQFMIDGMNCKCCPVFNTLSIIGKKFTLLLLRNMIFLNQKRFNEFLNSIEEINPKTLSIRLRELEKDRLIKLLQKLLKDIHAHRSTCLICFGC